MEGNKYCPIISKGEEKKQCDEKNCIFFDNYEYRCNLKNKEPKEITITDGLKIGIGISIWTVILAIIISTIYFFLIIINNDKVGTSYNSINAINDNITKE